MWFHITILAFYNVINFEARRKFSFKTCIFFNLQKVFFEACTFFFNSVENFLCRLKKNFFEIWNKFSLKIFFYGSSILLNFCWNKYYLIFAADFRFLFLTYFKKYFFIFFLPNCPITNYSGFLFHLVTASFWQVLHLSDMSS